MTGGGGGGSGAGGNGSNFRNRIVVLAHVLAWYAFSIGLTFYNKWLFKTYGLDFPLSITVVHMCVTTFLSGVVRQVRLRWYGTPAPRVPWHDMIYSISPAGVTGALDIGLSNMSLNLISITLYTMCKSTVIAWTLLAAFFFRLEKPSWPLCAVVAMISGGLVLFRAKEGVSFHSVGFFLVMSASALGGLRWVLTQLILHKEKERLALRHPVDTVYHVAPCMAVTLLPFALVLEGDELWSSPLVFAGSFSVLLSSLFTVFAGALLAFGLTISEFMLVNRTSGLALSVAGIVKEIATIIVAVLAMPNENALTALNVAGLALSIAGIAYYNHIKLNGAGGGGGKGDGSGSSSGGGGGGGGGSSGRGHGHGGDGRRREQLSKRVGCDSGGGAEYRRLAIAEEIEMERLHDSPPSSPTASD